MNQANCSVEGCPNEAARRGWCYMHYQRWLRRGDPGKAEPERHAPGGQSICTIDDCGRPVAGRGLCSKHWQRWKAHGDPEYSPAPNPASCSISGCLNGGRIIRGWCARHYEAWKVHGDPLYVSPLRRPLEERFWAKVSKDGPVPDYAPHLGPCWIWTAHVAANGYGSFAASHRRTQLAHRASYEISVGPIPDGLTIDHLCRVHACVNPAHLEAVTPRENVLRGDTVTAANAAKTHCPQLHEYTPDNAYVANGKRSCRRCERERRQKAG